MAGPTQLSATLARPGSCLLRRCLALSLLAINGRGAQMEGWSVSPGARNSAASQRRRLEVAPPAARKTAR